MSGDMQIGKGARALAGFLAIVTVLCALCAGEALLARYMSGGFGEQRVGLVKSLETEQKSYTIVIDAGHGGIDGGAVSKSGVLEKELNLSVAKRLEELCRLSGINCVMTRSDDRLVVDDSVKVKRKMHDLKNRVAIAEGIEDSILVSIHMNNFPDERYSGFQVWYSKNNESSRSLAAVLQTYARSFLDLENTREIKAAGSSIYLLDRTDSPAVLVECGFLSNPEECERLMTDEYQIELAMVILAALTDFMEGT